MKYYFNPGKLVLLAWLFCNVLSDERNCVWVPYSRGRSNSNSNDIVYTGRSSTSRIFLEIYCCQLFQESYSVYICPTCITLNVWETYALRDIENLWFYDSPNFQLPKIIIGLFHTWKTIIVSKSMWQNRNWALNFSYLRWLCSPMLRKTLLRLRNSLDGTFR